MTARHLEGMSRRPGQAFALGSAVALAVLSVPGVGLAASRGNSNDKQTICHATNSDNNPYVKITPNKNGDVSGHAKHTGPIWNAGLKAQHISWGDIIPPFDYNNHGTPAHFPGQNWTEEGQAWFNNGCNAPTGGGGGETSGTTGETTSTTGETTSTTGETSGTTGETTSTTGETTSTTGETTSTTGETTSTTGTTGPVTTTGGGGGGATTGFTGGGGGSFNGGSTSGGTFTGGGGTVTPSSLPKTGASFSDQLAYGGALVLGGAGIMLLTPRRRRATV